MPYYRNPESGNTEYYSEKTAPDSWQEVDRVGKAVKKAKKTLLTPKETTIGQKGIGDTGHSAAGLAVLLAKGAVNQPENTVQAGYDIKSLEEQLKLAQEQGDAKKTQSLKDQILGLKTGKGVSEGKMLESGTLESTVSRERAEIDTERNKKFESVADKEKARRLRLLQGRKRSTLLTGDGNTGTQSVFGSKPTLLGM